MKQSLLLVDDDAAIRESLADALRDDQLDVRVADSAEAALALLAEFRPDVLLTDVRMPGMSGLELLELVRERVQAVDVVLMTAYDDMSTVARAMRNGAADFLVKPIDLHQLRSLLARLADDRRTRTRAEALGHSDLRLHPVGHPEALVGRDARMIAVYKRIGQAAASRATVLIRGESGTGKELIARAIHANSAAANEPFIAVNCAALPPALLESELFGHLRGSFTGATGDRRGRFALAGRGTLFLDEIGDTTPELQAKLLRVLQEREYYPVGAERAERTEARVIAATHRDLESMVASGEFRVDLYYRLRVVEITVPPLRERPEDLPLLAQHLVLRASREAERHPPVLSPAVLQILLRHDWPGNVRELENTLTRAVVIASGDVIRPEHIEFGPGFTEPESALGTLSALERTHVERVLAATGGQKARAARILGISRPRLDRILKKHGLE